MAWSSSRAARKPTFLAPLAIERLWGVGASTRRQLAEFGVATIGDLAALPEDMLERRFGKHGRDLALRARGIGETVVGGHDAAKSVSHENTYDVDKSDWEVLEQTLLALSENVAARLRATNVSCSTVSVKIRNSSFETITRQRTLPEPTDMGEVIWRTAVELTRREVRGQRIRLLGVAASGLDEQRQLSCSKARVEDRRDGGRPRRPTPCARSSDQGDPARAAARRRRSSALRTRPAPAADRESRLSAEE